MPDLPLGASQVNESNDEKDSQPSKQKEEAVLVPGQIGGWPELHHWLETTCYYCRVWFLSYRNGAIHYVRENLVMLTLPKDHTWTLPSQL